MLAFACEDGPGLARRLLLEERLVLNATGGRHGPPAAAAHGLRRRDRRGRSADRLAVRARPSRSAPRERRAPHHQDRLLRGRARRGRARAAALLGRPRHERDAQVDPGRVRGRGGGADRQPRPAGRGLRRGARQGARPRRARLPRGGRARGVRPRLRAAGHQGERALRRRLPAVHRARAAADRQARRGAGPRARLRHDRPRLHRQGQRPGAHRGHRHRARPRAEDHRARARLADGARGGDRLRPRARHPGQGRHRGAAVLDRRQPLGPLVRGRPDRGPLRAAARRRLRAGHAARDAPDEPELLEIGFERGLPGVARRRAARPGRADRARRRDRRPPRRGDRRPHRGPHRRPEGARHLRGAGRRDDPHGAPGAREARRHDPPEPLQARARPASGPSSSTPGSGTSRCWAT